MYELVQDVSRLMSDMKNKLTQMEPSERYATVRHLCPRLLDNICSPLCNDVDGNLGVATRDVRLYNKTVRSHKI